MGECSSRAATKTRSKAGAYTIACRVIALVLYALSALSMEIGRAHATSVLVKTTYEVNVGGITVLDIKYIAGVSATEYHSRADIETRGVITFFSDYRMKMAVTGSLVDGEARPAEYTSRRKKNEKTKAIALNWSNKGLSAGNSESKEIGAALTPATVDPLTAVLWLSAAPRESPCRATQRVFDGKEVFDLRFNFTREVNFDADSPGPYRGIAYECRLTYLPVAGKYAAKFRNRKEVSPTYTVWLAPVETDVFGVTLLVPVRATGIIDGLEFVAYASRAKIGGRPFNQQSKIGD